MTVRRIGGGLAIALALALASCNSSTSGASQGAAGQPAPAAEPPGVQVYTPPAEGTTSLIGSVTVRRDADGQAGVQGRLLLPSGTRVWVDVYPAGTRSGDPLGHAELYLGPGGTFTAGPFKIGRLSQVQVEFTSHFSRAWQPAEVLALVGAGGMKLPKSALRPTNPQAPQSGGFLESSVTVPIDSFPSSPGALR